MTPTVLAFETSCDETAVAVVRGSEILSSALSSQVAAHARFGGVVPEVAARAHVEAIRSLTHRALGEAGTHPDDLDAVAATEGPGLVGALLVGHSFAKATAWARQLPFVGVDHMEGHLFAPRFEHPDYAPPAVALLVSGGHSQLVLVEDWGQYKVLGETIDDAAGEAFDKLARVLGLGYPGGPAIDEASQGGDPAAVRFPRALPDRRHHFSFSGLKTSVSTYVRRAVEHDELPSRADLAASIQEAIVDVLVAKTLNACQDTGTTTIAAGGGVVANRRLRQRLTEAASERGLRLHMPSPALCTDNGAMIGAAAVHWLEKGVISSWDATVDAGRRLA